MRCTEKKCGAMAVRVDMVRMELVSLQNCSEPITI